MAITLNDNISASAAKPLDALRGPYTGADEATAKAAACAAIAGGATGLRFVGRQVDLIINGVAAVYVWLSDIGDADLVPLTTPLPQALAPGDTPTFTGLILDGTNPLVVNKSTLTSDAPIIATQVNIPDFTEIDVLQCGIKNTDGNAVNWIFRGASVASGDAPYDVVLNLPQYTGGYLALKSDISAAQQLAFNDQAGTAYTLVLADANTKIRMSNTAANTVTIPTDASVAFPIGTRIYVSMNGTGATSIVGASGVTVEGVTTVIDVQYNEALLVKEGYDIWKVTGIIPDVSAVDGPLASIKRTASGNTVDFNANVQQAAGYGGSLSFNGANNQYITIPTTNFPSTSADFSMSCVFKTTSTDKVSLFCASSSGGAYRMGLQLSGTNINYTNNGGSGGAAITTAYNDGHWHLAVLTYDGSNAIVNIYVDNNLVATDSSTLTAGHQIALATATLEIGRGNLDGSGFYPFTGEICQFCCYTSVLGPTERADLWAGGTFTATPPGALGTLIRSYQFQDATGTSLADSQTNFTPYSGTLNNSPTWLVPPNGTITYSSTPAVAGYLTVKDGVNSGEKGQLLVGDVLSGTRLQGITVKAFINNALPWMIVNNGNTYVSATNTSENITPLSNLSVGGNTAIGSTYAIGTAAPANGLIVEGTTGLGTSSPSSAYILDIDGDSRSQGVFNNYGTIPEARWVTSGDSAYARLQRTTISSNNLFEGKNQVQQVGGIGKALRFLGYNQTVSGDDTGLPSGSAITMTYVTAFRIGVGTNPFYTPITYGSGSNKFIAYLGDHVLRLYYGSIAGAPLNYPSGVLLANLYYGDSYHDGNWHQMIFTISGQACNFYIDNTLLLTVTMTDTYDIILGGANSLLSFWRGDEVPYNVDLDQTLIYNRELNRTSGPGGTDEIAALWNGGGFTATPPVSGLVRRWECEEGNGNITYDISPGAKYPLTLVNAPSWLPVGIVPVSAVASEAVFFAITDGLTNAERGIATWGDFNGRNQQQGKWFQWFQGSSYPLVSNNTGQWLFNPTNASNTCPAILSTIEVAGNLAIGSGYSGINAAPANGLIVEGNTLLGTTIDNGIDQLQIDGNLNLTNIGNKLKIAIGTNASIGTATLVAGTITVNSTVVTTGSIIILTNASPGGTIGILSVGTKTEGTSFVINSSSATDTSTVSWWIVN